MTARSYVFDTQNPPPYVVSIRMPIPRFRKAEDFVLRTLRRMILNQPVGSPIVGFEIRDSSGNILRDPEILKTSQP